MDSLRHTHSSVWGRRKGQITELLSTYISIWGIRIWVPLAHLFICVPGHDHSFLYFPWIFLFFLRSILNWQEHLSSDFYFLFHSKCMDLKKIFLFCVGVWFIDRIVLVLGVSQLGSSVVSDFLQSHGPQHARLLCPSPTHGACSNSCPSSQWCHPTISSSVIPISSWLQCFPAPGSFPMSQFFASCGQSIGVSASASVLPINIQDWFPLGICIQITAMVGFGSRAEQFSYT